MKTLIITIYFFALTSRAFQPVDINNASIEQIALLPGVGTKLAHNIVEFRSQHGPIFSADRLLDVPGMNGKRLSALKDKITINANKKNIIKQQKTVEKTLITMPQKPILDLEELEKHVLDAQGLNMEFDRSMAYRVRRSGFLPKLSPYIEIGSGQTTLEKLGDNQVDSGSKRGGNNLGFGVRATFDLDKLIFNSEELEVAKLSLRRLEKREAILKELHRNYFKYVSLIAASKKPLDAVEADAVAFEMKEMEAELNSMSAGAFKRLQTKDVPSSNGDS